MTTAPTPAGAMAIFGENKREFHQLSAIEKRLNWRLFVSELLRMQMKHEPGRFLNDGGILAYNLLLPEEDMRNMFPNINEILFPANPGPFAANASQAAMKIWDIDMRLVEALKAMLATLKEILMLQCKEEIQHLEDYLTVPSNRGCRRRYHRRRHQQCQAELTRCSSARSEPHHTARESSLPYTERCFQRKKARSLSAIS
jgi:hypothetical protein